MHIWMVLEIWRNLRKKIPVKSRNNSQKTFKMIPEGFCNNFQIYFRKKELKKALNNFRKNL